MDYSMQNPDLKKSRTTKYENLRAQTRIVGADGEKIGARLYYIQFSTVDRFKLKLQKSLTNLFLG
jgi:hypothetical protein